MSRTLRSITEIRTRKRSITEKRKGKKRGGGGTGMGDELVVTGRAMKGRERVRDSFIRRRRRT
jgi:hypothetical protein